MSVFQNGQFRQNQNQAPRRGFGSLTLPGSVVAFAALGHLGGCATSPAQSPTASTAELSSLAPGSQLSPSFQPNLVAGNGNPSGGSSPPLTTPQSNSSHERQYIDLTPLTKMSFVKGDSTPNGGDYFDAYTRVILLNCSSVDCTELATASDANSQPLPYHSRDPLSRFLIGQSVSYNFSVVVNAGSFTKTFSLVTIDHKSNSKDGEQWSQAVYHDVEANPLFLVTSGGEGGTPSIKAELKANIQTTSQAASQVVSAILSVAKDASPSGPVVTALTKTAIQSQASAIDKALGTLFGKSIDEANSTDRDLAGWSPSAGVLVTLSIPYDNTKLDSPPKWAGKWIVKFDDPRPSVFVDWRICDSNSLKRCAGAKIDAQGAVYRDVDAGQVLKFTLTSDQNNLGLIENYLSQQSWYKFDTPILSDSSDRAKADDAATDFCENIQSGMEGVGLSSVDANIVVWATYMSMTGLNAGARKSILQNRSCQNFIKQVNSHRAGMDKISDAEFDPKP